MEQIRYVKIPLTETRTEPNTHVVYGLHVQGPVRSWTVWHRYSDFLVLAYELSREFPGSLPPGTLPPKRSMTSWFSKLSSNDVEFIEERRHALERYLQSMIVCDDDRWRLSKSLQSFLAPASKGSKYLAGKNTSISNTGSETGSLNSDSSWVTAASWLNDHREAEQVVRDIRQCILCRENALTRNEISTSHQSLLQAKRQLTELARSIKGLEAGLEQIKGSLTAGELLRRQDMLMRLNEDKANLTRIVTGPNVASSSGDRSALLDGASSASGSTRVIGWAGSGNNGLHRMPGSMPMHSQGMAQQGMSDSGSRQAPRSRRIFGNSNPPQETNETRGLDNQGLLQLQNDRMQEQDRIASEFSLLLRRQREMGHAIGDELDLQNQLLTELDQDLDRTGNKLAAARRQANRL
ncbi:hypothetical protein LPJ78_001149 [Coemansia sp. RSA 989]|nr:hypothetical protein LPJ68_000595 [Coemansia sp. RSA 1086]KAJ1751820.1 hypothetical protein LPJ79_001780 [Coemansia sp. RSA 1821]KAJ1867204.1 hypothetical protein LPJ78_001149 [Coemansia sp. RSA 989]KAJ1876060.1 hypothetical protein LPJ55_000241 [Coemansia sp. RSA 990]KAJ2652505.1 hypothetical protein IWW40_000990 [Coemansia sp. RSA 1250]KAJ2674036.1 hypothetical protein IWW42_001855 [Coemansia sp. RSA 1085]